jgi:peptidyl-dipeptidase A
MGVFHLIGVRGDGSGINEDAMCKSPYVLTSALVVVLGSNSIMASPEMTEQAKKFVAAHEAKVRPLDIAAGLAWWNANISGKDEDFKK